MSVKDRDKIYDRMRLQLQKTREYKEKKCTFEELMVVSSVTNVAYLDLITANGFECIEKIKDLEKHLSQFDSSRKL